MSKSREAGLEIRSANKTLQLAYVARLRRTSDGAGHFDGNLGILFK